MILTKKVKVSGNHWNFKIVVDKKRLTVIFEYLVAEKIDAVAIEIEQEYESRIVRYIEGCEGYLSLAFKYPPPRIFHDL